MLNLQAPDSKSFLVGTIGAGLADIAIILPVQMRAAFGVTPWAWQAEFVLAWSVACSFLVGTIFGLWLTRDVSFRQALLAFVITFAVGAAAGLAMLHWTGVS